MAAPPHTENPAEGSKKYSGMDILKDARDFFFAFICPILALPHLSKWIEERGIAVTILLLITLPLGIFLFYKRHRTKVTQESVFIIKQAPIVIFISLGLIVVLAGISLNFNNQNAEMKQQLLDATNVVQRIESKIDDLTNFVSKAVSPRGTVIFNEKLLHKFIITNTPHNQYKYQTIEEFRSDLPRGFKRYHVHAVLIGYCTNAVRVQFFVKTSSIVDWHDGTGVQDGKEIKINGSDKSSDGVSTTEKEFTSMIDAEFTAYQIAPQIWIDVLQDSDKEKEVILSPETSLTVTALQDEAPK
jgi:hypothetical protein